MSTKIRPELSRRNKWWIPKYRFLELKYYCLQYDSWQKEYQILSSDLGMISPRYKHDRVLESKYADKTADIAIRRIILENKIRMVQRLTCEADYSLSEYLLKAVTRGMTYPELSTKYDMPCGNNMFYDRWHKFFYLLDKEKN